MFQKGTVTMWSPSVKDPLVKMLTHRGPLISMAVDTQGLCVYIFLHILLVNVCFSNKFFVESV